MLDISQLHKNFGGLKAVNNMSLKINTGEIVGLIGPNGAGKTTFFNCISGAITPTSGSINFQGKEIMGFKPYQVCRSGLGRTYQIVKPFGKLTVKENIIVGALNSVNSIKQASELADEVMELTSLTKYSNMEAGSLPLPGRKRLEVARAVATKPALLLLDEVMAGLNPSEVDKAVELIFSIKNYGITILIIEHLMKVITSVSDRIVVMHHGEKLAEGEPKEVLSDQAVVKAYLGEKFHA